MLRQRVALEQILQGVRHGDDRGEAQHHAQGAEGELLNAVLVPRELYGRCQVHQGLPAQQAEHQAHEVAGQGAIGVGAAQVDHGDELGEEDHVDEVRAEEPEPVDRLDGDAHHRSQHTHSQNGATHHPDDFTLRRLKVHKEKKSFNP